MLKYYFGEDRYRIEKQVEMLAAKEPEAELYNFQPAQIKEFLTSLNAISFFATKRFFVARDFFKDKKQSLKAELITALAAVDESTTVFLLEEAAPGAALKKLALEEKEFPLLKGSNLTKYIKEKVAEEGGDIAPLAAERLATFVGGDLTQLEEEIKKLILYKRDGSPDLRPIESADVDLLVHANYEANIFQFVDAIANRNAKSAEALLSSFVQAGENPLYLLSMIIRQFRNIAQFVFEPGISEAEFASKTGQHPFVGKKTKAQAKNFSKEDVKEIYASLLLADLQLKSGAEPLSVLQRLILIK